MYISFVPTLLEYSDSKWNKCTQDDKKEIDSLQTEATRIIMGATKLCSIENFYLDLGWETLQERRSYSITSSFLQFSHPKLSYTMVCLPVRDDNPRALGGQTMV